MAILETNEQTYQKDISEGQTILYFTGVWCGPCKMLRPVLEELSEEMKEVQIRKVDVDENQDLAANFGVMSVPTLLLFKDGEPIAQKFGYAPKEAIAEWIKNA